MELPAGQTVTACLLLVFPLPPGGLLDSVLPRAHSTPSGGGAGRARPGALPMLAVGETPALPPPRHCHSSHLKSASFNNPPTKHLPTATRCMPQVTRDRVGDRGPRRLFMELRNPITKTSSRCVQSLACLCGAGVDKSCTRLPAVRVVRLVMIHISCYRLLINRLYLHHYFSMDSSTCNREVYYKTVCRQQPTAADTPRVCSLARLYQGHLERLAHAI